MGSERTKEQILGHLLDAFDEALVHLGGSEAAAIELTHELAKHAASKQTNAPRPMKMSELEWALCARKFMEENVDAVAVVTMVVDRKGLIVPLVSTKDLPEMLGETMRAAVTEFLSNVCKLIFQRPFHCGCRTCESGGAKELRDALHAGTAWNGPKAEA